MLVRPHDRRLAPSIAVLMGLVVLSACSGRADEPEPQDVQDAGQNGAIGHVHGLGIDPGDDALYVASHFGVFRVASDGSRVRIADRWQDTMGFAVVGPRHFLGSGHPDLREDLPSSLGLIESKDGARTWESLSLLGEADLHAIEAVGGRIYAFDSITGSLLVTTDRTTWSTISTQPLYDLAADPAVPNTIYATTDRGVLVSSDNGAEPDPVPGAPELTVIDWQPSGPLVGVTADGTVLTSSDTTKWSRAGELDGPAQALDAVAGRWVAATATSLYESTDEGDTWNVLLAGDS